MGLDRPFLFKLVAALAGLFATAAIFYGLFGVAVTLLVTGIVALLIGPVADRLERRRVPRGLTVSGIYLLVILAVGVVAVLLLRPLTDQRANRSTGGEEFVVTVERGAQRILGPGASLEAIGVRPQQAAAGERGLAQALLSALAAVGDFIVDVMLIGVPVLFLVTDPSLGRSLLRVAVPAPHRDRAERTVGAISGGRGRWLMAQLGISLYHAVTYTIVNVVLGIPYGVTIGVVSGLLEFIPDLGGLVGLIMTLLAALTVSPQTAIWAFILGAVVGVIGGNVVGPHLLGKAAQVHPALIIIALIVGGLLGGTLGVLLAMPVTVIIVILFQELRSTGHVGAAMAAGQAAVAGLRAQPTGVEPSDPA